MTFNKEKNIEILKLLPKYLVIVRHGESEKDKTNPNRQLTTLGQEQVRQTAEILKGRFTNQTVRVICTPRLRTKQTAAIIAGVFSQDLSVDEIPEEVAFIGDWSKIISQQQPGETLTETYFRLAKNQLDLTLVKPPQKYSIDLLCQIVQMKLNTEVIILVTHAGEGDALQQQNYYQLESPCCWEKELECGEARILIKN